nr:putative ribonuclease H-like domain-containing protein [Tanacetum cinerariifolium]
LDDLVDESVSESIVENPTIDPNEPKTIRKEIEHQLLMIGYLKVRKNMSNVVPQGGLTCLFAKATTEESSLWHRRLGHVNFKTINKLVKGNLVRGSGPTWIFDIDALTKFMNYKPFVADNQSNGSTGKARVETVHDKDYILLLLWTQDPPFYSSSKDSPGDGYKPSGEEEKKDTKDLGNEDSEAPITEEPRVNQEKDSVNSTNRINAVSSTVNATSNEVNAVGKKSSIKLPDDPNMPELEDISIFEDSYEDVFGAEADLNNLESTFQVSHIPITRIHKDHPLQQVIGDLHSAPQIRRMSKNLEAHGLVSSKWVFRNKLDKRGIVIRNKARLEAQGHTQEEGIDYNEVFAPVARIKAIRLFLAYASFKNFFVYQMDVKSVFLYRKIKEEVYVFQPPRFKDPVFLEKVYKVEKVLYGLHQAPISWKEMCTEFEKMMHKKFQMSSIGELTFFLGLQVKQKEDGIFISQDKYVNEILNKFGYSDVKTASTPMETHKTFLKDEKGEDVDEQSYRSMIGSLMYLTSLRPNIMFAAKIINGEAQIHAKVDGKKVIISEATIRRDLKFEDEGGFDCLSNKVIFEQLPLIGTMASAIICLATNQKFNFTKYIFDSMKKQKPRKPRRHDPEENQPSGPITNLANEALNEENVPTQFNDPPLSRVNTFGSGEDNLKLKELMKLCTKLSDRVLNLETTKIAQAKEISSLKRRVKRLKKKRRSRTHRLKRLYKIGLSARVKSSTEE